MKTSRLKSKGNYIQRVTNTKNKAKKSFYYQINNKL